MISALPSKLLAQVGGMTCPGPWSLALRLQDKGVDLTLPLQNMDGSASLPLKLYSALTQTWATSSRPREE